MKSKKEVEEKSTIPKLKFQSLAPVIMEEADYKEYEDAFEQIMQEDSLCNIAIAGEYGSGKSSVIETFLSKNKGYKKKTMRISLRNYDCTDKNVGINVLEKKVLNQIIIQMDRHHIFGSGIYTKQHLRDEVKVSAGMLCFILVLALMYYIVIPKLPFVAAVSNDLNYNFLYYADTQWTLFWFFIIIGLWVVIKLLNQLPSGWFPDKVSCVYKETELAIEKNGTTIDQALYDTYIDEIVYLLRKQKTKLMVIEDLDRFNNVEIFEQLREINFLINVQAEKEHRVFAKLKEHIPGLKSKRIKFIYLVKDSLFDNNGWDRTKFFDVIIPVAPCIGGAESWKMMKYMCPGLSAIEPDVNSEMETFFQLHLNDYRMLKNLANEFNLSYNRRQRFGAEKFEFNKMLGMLVYKNLFPLDWAHLQKKKGYIYSCLQVDEYLQELAVEKGDESIRYAYDTVFDKILGMEEDMLEPFSMKKEYWEKLKEHSEYELLVKLVKNGYIEKKDYELYIRILGTQDVDVLNLRKYSYAISHKKRTPDLQFDTEISEEMWNKLSSQMKQDFDYYSEALVNKDIIRYMLNSIKNGSDVWWDRTLFVAESCSVKEKYEIYDMLSGIAKENWALLAWTEDLFEWDDKTQKKYIFEYVVNALKGASRYDRLNEFYEEKGYDRSGFVEVDVDGEARYPEDEPFLEYIFAEKSNLFNALEYYEDALCVLFDLIGFGVEPLKVCDISYYAGNRDLMMRIWKKKNYEPTKDNIHIFATQLDSDDINLENLKSICPDMYKEWMSDENINSFVDRYYIRYLLPRVCGEGGKGFEEVQELLRNKALREGLKEEIIKNMPQAAYPQDLTKLSNKWKKKFIEEKILGYSANNIVMLLRENGHIFTDEVCRFVEKCREVSMENPERFHGLTIELTDGEKKQILGALGKAYTDDATDVWLSHQLGLFEVDDDPEVA